MKKITRIIAALLALVLLSACTPKEAGQAGEDLQLPGASTQDAPGAPGDEPTQQTAGSAQQTADAPRAEGYAISALPLPEGMVMATAQHRCGEKIYTGGVGQDGAVFGYTCADRTRKTLPLGDAFDFVYAMCEKEDGFAVLCGTYPIAYNDAQENFVVNDPPEGALSILTFDADGAFLARTDLHETYKENGYTFKQMALTERGYVLQSRAAIVALGADGAELGRITLDKDRQFAAMQEVGGTFYAITADIGFGEAELHALDLEQYALASTVVLQGQSICGLGTDESGAVLVNNGTTNRVSRIDLLTGGLSDVIVWDEVGLATQDYLELAPWDGGYLLYAPYQKVISALRPATGAARQDLILACGETVYAGDLVNEFNQSQEKYRVKVVRYGTEENTMDMLRTQIIAGEAPDLYCFASPQPFAEAACADLLPFLDADPQTGRDWCIDSLREAMMDDGKLYWLPYTFALNTWVCDASVFSQSGVSPEQWQKRLRELETDDPIFECFITSDWLLYWYSSFAMGQFIDFEAGSCAFDSGEFAQMLRFCRDWGQGGAISMTPERPVMKFRRIADAAMFCAPYGSEEQDYCYVGFPTEGGNGSMFETQMCFALSRQGEGQDGAWEFLRFAMQRLANTSGAALWGLQGLPASEQAMQTRLQYLVETGDTFLDDTIKITEIDAEKARALLAETRVLGSANEEIRTIIAEEGAAFFAGQCSEQDAAERVQNRVSLYLMENQW